MYLDGVDAGVERELRVEHGGADGELLEEELEAVAGVEGVDEEEALALQHAQLQEHEEEQVLVLLLFGSLFGGWGRVVVVVVVSEEGNRIEHIMDGTDGMNGRTGSVTKNCSSSPSVSPSSSFRIAGLCGGCANVGG